MNVETIRMDPAVAHHHLTAYRAQLHRRADAEYEAVVAGLTALEQGTPIILLSTAITGGGYFANNGMPRLAVARADQRQVRCRWQLSGNRISLMYTGDRHWRTRSDYNHRTTEFTIDTNLDRLPAGANYNAGTDAQPRWFTHSGSTLVPMIPATVREVTGRFRADRRFILWEVEQWKLVPPADPLLLRHLGGDAYAVEAAWELTPLERAVMAGRAQQVS